MEQPILLRFIGQLHSRIARGIKIKRIIDGTIINRVDLVHWPPLSWTLTNGDAQLFLSYGISGIVVNPTVAIEVIKVSSGGICEEWRFNDNGQKVQIFDPTKFPPFGFEIHYDENGELREVTLADQAKTQFTWRRLVGTLCYQFTHENGPLDELRFEYDLPYKVILYGNQIPLNSHQFPFKWQDENAYERMAELFPHIKSWYRALLEDSVMHAAQATA